MVVIGINDIPIWSSTSTSGNLESRRFRHLYNGMDYYYILECCDLMTNIIYYIMITDGNVYDCLEVERLKESNRRSKFSLKKVLIPENGAYTISIDNDYNWMNLS